MYFMYFMCYVCSYIYTNRSGKCSGYFLFGLLWFLLVFVFVLDNYFELLVHVLVISQNLHSPESIAQAQTDSQADETVFPWRLPCWEHPQSYHEPGKRKTPCAERSESSWILLILKFSSVKLSKLIRRKNRWMLLNEILFLFYIRIPVGQHLDKLTMRCKCRKILQHF